MKRLKELRTQRGLTQTQVGDIIGVSCVTIARYEAGDREPSNSKITTLADYFGVTVDYLMGRDEPVQEDQESIPAYLQESYDLLLQLTPEEYAEILEMAKFKLYQRQNGKNEKA